MLMIFAAPLVTATLGTRSGDSNLWELVTPAAGNPQQICRPPHISGDIYRWVCMTGSACSCAAAATVQAARTKAATAGERASWGQARASVESGRSLTGR